MTEKTSCKSCGRTLPEGAPGGLCPACVMLAAVESEAGAAVPSIGEVQQAFPNLEIVECIGRGGMGIVYKAWQPHLGRHVALKLLDPGLHADPDFAERFAREAKFLGKLAHPHIVAVHDFGETRGYFWLMMEYVDGVNLRQAMQAGRFSPEQALAVIPEICAALQFAHDQGVLHRDIKPENILLDAKGRVKIADFGIARLADGKGDSTLTRTGAALGSAAYIAPEQIETPHDVDHRADIYSLGVVFYEMLTGELPLGRFPAPSEKSASDPRLDEVVFRALEKERDRRFQSADDVRTEVRDFYDKPHSGPAVSVRETALPWSVKLPLLLVGGGFAGLAAMFLSLPDGLAACYWRLLTFKAGGFSLNLAPGLRICLNLWFCMSVAALAGGFALGMRSLNRIRKGVQSQVGWSHLRRFVLWPLIVLVPAYVLNWLFNSGDLGESPRWGRGVMPVVQALCFCSVFIATAVLLHLGGSPAKSAPSSPWKGRSLLALSILLFLSASVVTKRLHNHPTEVYSQFEFNWDLSSLPESGRKEMIRIAREAGSPYHGQPEFRSDGSTLTVGLIVGPDFMLYPYQNSYEQRLMALAPENVRSVLKRPVISSVEWWEAERARNWPTVYMVVATMASAFLAAWSGPLTGLFSCGLAGVVAGVLALLPAWPIPQEIQRRAITGLPPEPLLPLTPDFSNPVKAAQTVLFAAHFDEADMVRQGMSSRLLAELADPAKFQEAMRLLKSNRWVAGWNREGVVIHTGLRNSDGAVLLEAGTVEERGKWKLDELPHPGN